MDNTNKEVTMTPVKELTTVTMLPIIVTGIKSPKPTVVMVSMAAQRAFYIADKDLN